MPPEAFPERSPGPSRATRPTPSSRAAALRADWLRLALVDGLGPARMQRLLRAFGAPADILAAPARRLAQVVETDIAIRLATADPAREVRVAASLEWLEAAPERHLLTLDDDAYPPAWLNLADPPPCVMVQGRLEALAMPAVAIVGSRHASAGGARSARDFAAGLAGEGWAVASGLALGIDAAAHAGALDAGGVTVAFVGTGLDRVYPARNRALAARIAAAGAIVSEFALGTEALRSNFPRRNRLIAAHSRGVLVVEAARRSGSLITALAAADLGREVFAVPGSIHSPQARGCHWLIRQGAALVEELADIREGFPSALRPAPPSGIGATAMPARAVATAPGPAAAATLAGLDWHPASVDALAQRLPFDVPALLAALLELELAGQVERLADGRYQRTRPDEGPVGSRPARVARPVGRPV